MEILAIYKLILRGKYTMMLDGEVVRELAPARNNHDLQFERHDEEIAGASS